MLDISFKYLLTLLLSIFKRSPKKSMAEVLKSSCLRNESIWVGFATNEIHWRVMGILLGSPNSSYLVFYCHSNQLPQTWQLKQHTFTVFQFWRSDVWYGLASGCWQGCIAFWASRGQSISFPFLGSRSHSYSLTFSPLLPSSKPVTVGQVFFTWHQSDLFCFSLLLLKTLVMTVGDHLNNPGPSPSCGQLISNFNSICHLNYPLPRNLTQSQVSGIRTEHHTAYQLPRICTYFLWGWSVYPKPPFSCQCICILAASFLGKRVNWWCYLQQPRHGNDLNILSTDEWIKKKWCICNGILLSHKKERDWVFCRHMDRPRICQYRVK